MTWLPDHEFLITNHAPFQLAAPEGFSARWSAPARTVPGVAASPIASLLVSIIAFARYINGEIMPQSRLKVNRLAFSGSRSLAAQNAFDDHQCHEGEPDQDNRQGQGHI